MNSIILAQQQSISSLFQTNSSPYSMLKTICGNLKKNTLSKTQTKKNKSKIKTYETKRQQSQPKSKYRYQKIKFKQQYSKIQRSQNMNHDLELREYLTDFNKKFKENIKLKNLASNFTQSIQQTQQEVGKCEKQKKKKQFKYIFLKQNIKTQISQENIKIKSLSNNPIEKAELIRINAITLPNNQNLQDLSTFKKMFKQISQKKNQQIRQLLEKQLKLPKLKKTLLKRQTLKKGRNFYRIEARLSTQNTSSENNIENTENTIKNKNIIIKGRNSLKVCQKTSQQSILRASALQSLK